MHLLTIGYQQLEQNCFLFSKGVKTASAWMTDVSLYESSKVLTFTHSYIEVQWSPFYVTPRAVLKSSFLLCSMSLKLISPPPLVYRLTFLFDCFSLAVGVVTYERGHCSWFFVLKRDIYMR
jgi:hypothetical protein